jgi:hypothetical protein
MTNYRNILFAALGGAVTAALIAAVLVGKKKEEPFPLSPSNNLDKVAKRDPELVNNELENTSEVLQQS